MIHIATRSTPQEALRHAGPRIAIITAGAMIGVGLAALPLTWAVIGLTVFALIAATVFFPLVGLGTALIFATFKPLTDYFVPDLPLDIGQLALIATLSI